MLHTVGAIIFNYEGKILIQDHVKIGGLTLPSGKLDAGEDPVEGLKRELREELDVGCVLVSNLLLSWEEHFEELGDVKQHLYGVVIDKEPTNVEPEKHPSLQWLTPKEIQASGKYCSSYLRHALTVLNK